MRALDFFLDKTSGRMTGWTTFAFKFEEAAVTWLTPRVGAGMTHCLVPLFR